MTPPVRRLPRSNDNGNLIISIGSMLVAHAAFVAVAIALPEPPERPRPITVPVPLRQVEVAVAPADEELEEMEPTWREPEPEPQRVAFPDPPELPHAGTEPKPLPPELIPTLPPPDLDPPSDLTFLQPEEPEPERPKPAPRHAVASRAFLVENLVAEPAGIITNRGSRLNEVFARGGTTSALETPVEGGVVGGVAARGGGLVLKAAAPMGAYAKRLRKRIMASLKPAPGTFSGGQIVLSLTISPEGKLQRHRITRSTASTAARKTVLDALATLDELPAPPPSKGLITIAVHLHFR